MMQHPAGFQISHVFLDGKSVTIIKQLDSCDQSGQLFSDDETISDLADLDCQDRFPIDNTATQNLQVAMHLVDVSPPEP